MIYAVNKRTREHRRYSDATFRASHYEHEWEVVQADPDGWIKYRGDKCPLPLDAGCDIKAINYRTTGCRAGDVSWEDVVAYRPRMPEPQAPEWDGKGLPPVGCECEAKDDYSQWQRCRIAGVEGSQLWIDFHDDGYATSHIDDIDIRPFRSEEDRFVDQVNDVMKAEGLYSLDRHARALYRAGYRKEAA